MNGKLNVEPAKLKSAATSFSSTGNAIESLTRNMTNLVSQISGDVWSGDAANAYKKKFQNLQDDISKMTRMIKEHAEDLNNMAQQYQTAENSNKALAQSLSDNIIS